MGLDHLLLWEAIRRTADDRVQSVRHMGALVVREDQEIQRSRHLLLPQVQGRAAVGTQKGPLGTRRMGGTPRSTHPVFFAVLLTLVFFDAYSQNSLNYHLDGNRIVTL